MRSLIKKLVLPLALALILTPAAAYAADDETPPPAEARFTDSDALTATVTSVTVSGLAQTQDDPASGPSPAAEDLDSADAAESTADLAELKALIATATSLIESEINPSETESRAYDLLSEAIAAAEAVTNSPNPTQTQADSAAAALLEALKAFDSAAAVDPAAARDLNGDGEVTAADLSLALYSLNAGATEEDAGEGTIAVPDITALVSALYH
jgi:hypothetical protein